MMYLFNNMMRALKSKAHCGKTHKECQYAPFAKLPSQVGLCFLAMTGSTFATALSLDFFSAHIK